MCEAVHSSRQFAITCCGRKIDRNDPRPTSGQIALDIAAVRNASTSRRELSPARTLNYFEFDEIFDRHLSAVLQASTDRAIGSRIYSAGLDVESRPGAARTGAASAHRRQQDICRTSANRTFIAEVLFQNRVAFSTGLRLDFRQPGP